MKMNRRNVLVGLGGLAIGGGALFGSGAFDQVEADRSVSVTTAADSAALIAFTNLDSDYVTENADGAIEIDISDVNVDGTLTINDAFTIENNHTEQVTLNDPWSVDENNITVTLTAADGTLDASTGTTTVDIEVDTTDATSSATLDADITISAST